MMELNNIRKTNLKPLIFLILILVLSFLSISCSRGDIYDYEPQDYDNTIFPEELIGSIKDKNIYLTSIGQSGDMAEFEEVVLSNMNLFTYTSKPFLKADSVESNSVVLIFVGCSIKALAESETTIDEELERACEFCEALNKRNIKLICFHMGGQSRRGSSSDMFINVLFPDSYFNVYLDKSNSDNYLYNISKENNVKSYQVISMLSLEQVINLLYGVEKE